MFILKVLTPSFFSEFLLGVFTRSFCSEFLLGVFARSFCSEFYSEFCSEFLLGVLLGVFARVFTWGFCSEFYSQFLLGASLPGAPPAEAVGRGVSRRGAVSPIAAAAPSPLQADGLSKRGVQMLFRCFNRIHMQIQVASCRRLLPCKRRGWDAAWGRYPNVRVRTLEHFMHFVFEFLLRPSYDPSWETLPGWFQLSNHFS